MNKIDQAKIHLYLNQHEYLKLEQFIHKSEENEKYVFKYIVDKFARKQRAISAFTLTKLLDCMSDEYIRRTLNYLINEPNFYKGCLKLILEKEKLNGAILNERKKYIKEYVDTLDFMGIIDLYNHKNTSDDDKNFIKDCLHEKILDVDNAYKLAYAQQIKGTEIISKYLIEKTILESNLANYVYYLMQLRGYNKNRLINKLAELKDKDGYNKKVFIEALAEFFPCELAKVPMGLVVSEINSSITNSDTCGELIVKVSNAIVKSQKEAENKNKTLSYVDEETIKKEPVKKRN